MTDTPSTIQTEAQRTLLKHSGQSTAVLDSSALLGSTGRVEIVHGPDRYTLRRTKQGKLILTK